MFRDWQITIRANPPPNPNQSGRPPPPPGPFPPPPRPLPECSRPFQPPPPPIYKPPPPKYDQSAKPFEFGPPSPNPYCYERAPPYSEPSAITFTWAPPPYCVGTFEWVPCHDGHVPPGAAEAGLDADRGPIYVGRAYHHGDLLPAKVCPRHRCAFVSFAGREVEERHCEVLISNHISWKPARGGNIPPDAIRVGQTSYGEGLYMGRTMYQGTLTPGKVHPSQGCLYIPWDGVELRFTEYEILVLV